jgi:hypothetical protein
MVPLLPLSGFVAKAIAGSEFFSQLSGLNKKQGARLGLAGMCNTRHCSQDNIFEPLTRYRFGYANHGLMVDNGF